MHRILTFLLLSLIYLQNTAQNIIPEWKNPKGLVLVYPKDLRSSLVNCYKELIKSVTSSSDLHELTLIIRPSAKKEIELFCQTLETKTKITVFETSKIQDIWARVFCPIYFSNNVVFKSLYRPSYFTKNQIIKYSISDNQTGIDLANFLKLKVNYFIHPIANNLILDGGNFISNGQGTAIVTNKIIADNQNLSTDEIKQIFKTQIGISNLIILPVEPGDITGHIDGTVRFINDSTLIVSSYPDIYSKGQNNISEEDYIIDKQFLDNIADTLIKSFTVKRLVNDIPKNDGVNGVASAFGNYINFLRIGNYLFLPQYDIPQDEISIDFFNKNFPELTIVPIKKDIDKLSKLGGVLNCISWQYY